MHRHARGPVERTRIAGVLTKLARSRTMAKAARMLFKELVKELGPFTSEYMGALGCQDVVFNPTQRYNKDL